jgi:hypothetical protein
MTYLKEMSGHVILMAVGALAGTFRQGNAVVSKRGDIMFIQIAGICDNF